MSNSASVARDKNKYSKHLSALFCSTSIIVLSILSLLNNLSLDLYSVLAVLKVVVPGSFCFWFLGHVMGTIFEKHGDKNSTAKLIKLSENDEAYKIPSMFEGNAATSGDDELQ